ncbi:MAG: ABC transporter ATP-binding protein [Firmicutes bacterium]|nr:ABC transporter ATP-binding protein [Bacillota bacterium]
MSQNEKAYIRMDDLSVGYNGKALIRDICIDIRKGDIVTLIGPNGAGKSTILKSITRQLALIGGKVYFDEQNLHSMPARDLSQKMAVVLTERLKTDLLTCYDIVASGRYPYTGKLGLLTEEDERMVDEAMAVVHATELGPKDFNAISDGQRQRILLARAICQDPEIIILDEPTSFLDIRYKLELLTILRSMAKKKGITVIMSLHEIDLAEKISDRIICVKGDRIYRYGVPEEIFHEDMIRELYSLDNGFFDPLFGSIELPAPAGDAKAGGSAPFGREEDAGSRAPRVLVLSSGGSGIPVYRRLQKENAPFIAGVLSENDIDYQLARLLAAEVITTPPFEEIAEPAFARAKECVEQCGRVIAAEFPIGTTNARMRDLIDLAERLGKLERV